MSTRIAFLRFLVNAQLVRPHFGLLIGSQNTKALSPHGTVFVNLLVPAGPRMILRSSVFPITAPAQSTISILSGFRKKTEVLRMKLY